MVGRKVLQLPADVNKRLFLLLAACDHGPDMLRRCGAERRQIDMGEQGRHKCERDDHMHEVCNRQAAEHADHRTYLCNMTGKEAKSSQISAEPRFSTKAVQEVCHDAESGEREGYGRQPDKAGKK